MPHPSFILVQIGIDTNNVHLKAHAKSFCVRERRSSWRKPASYPRGLRVFRLHELQRQVHEFCHPIEVIQCNRDLRPVLRSVLFDLLVRVRTTEESAEEPRGDGLDPSLLRQFLADVEAVVCVRLADVLRDLVSVLRHGDELPHALEGDRSASDVSDSIGGGLREDHVRVHACADCDNAPDGTGETIIHSGFSEEAVHSR